LVYYNEENHLLHAEVRAGVLHEHVIFDEGSGVAQNLDTFAGSQFSLKIKVKLGINIYNVSITMHFISSIIHKHSKRIVIIQNVGLTPVEHSLLQMRPLVTVILKEYRC
jgi:hypothetical protein